MSWVYRKTEPNLWTVGFYAPDGTWEPESDHDNPEEAAQRCRWLNGGGGGGHSSPADSRGDGEHPAGGSDY
jgi:hypothetical protein